MRAWQAKHNQNTPHLRGIVWPNVFLGKASEAFSEACDPGPARNFQPEVSSMRSCSTSVLGPLSCHYRESLAVLFPSRSSAGVWSRRGPFSVAPGLRAV